MPAYAYVAVWNPAKGRQNGRQMEGRENEVTRPATDAGTRRQCRPAKIADRLSAS